jgi:osmotically-inducible protein OsmY
MKTKTLPSQLQKDVSEELQWEPGLDSAKVGVSVVEGVVQLSGHVRSLAEKLAAERAAKRVRGVGAVANELEVELSPAHVRDDLDIAKAAQQALHWNVAIPDDKLKVTVSGGWLTLEGEVMLRYQARLAENAVACLTGVRGVTNRIVVRSGLAAGDVRRQLTAALHRYAAIEAGGIDVQISGGKVVLVGRVRTWPEKELVEDAAWATPSVTMVENRLEVRS